MTFNDICPEPQNTTTVLQFLCRDPVNDGAVIDQYGDSNGPPYPCKWIVTYGSTVVCAAIKNPPHRISPPPTSGPNGGLSGGSIFLIALLVTIVVYCTAGIAFNKIKRQQTGLSLIPNSGFWRELPALVGDGFTFTWSKIRGRARSTLAATADKSLPTSYQSI